MRRTCSPAIACCRALRWYRKNNCTGFAASCPRPLSPYCAQLRRRACIDGCGIADPQPRTPSPVPHVKPGCRLFDPFSGSPLISTNRLAGRPHLHQIDQVGSTRRIRFLHQGLYQVPSPLQTGYIGMGSCLIVFNFLNRLYDQQVPRTGRYCRSRTR